MHVTVMLYVVVVTALTLTLTLAEAPIDLVALRRLQAESEESQLRLEHVFSSFKRILNKQYKDADEEFKRKQIFVDRLHKIRAHNQLYDRGEKSYGIGINKFSDMTHREFIEMYTTLRWRRNERIHAGSTTPPPEHKPEGKSKRCSKCNSERKQEDSNQGSKPSVPESVDWRAKGYVTSVKDQGDCGSCWAFAVLRVVERQIVTHDSKLYHHPYCLSRENDVPYYMKHYHTQCTRANPETAAVEGMMYRNTGNITSLSVQQLVDCDKKNTGCDGGVPQEAINYIGKAGGVMAESDYPYKALDMECKFDQSKVIHGSHATSVVVLPSDDEKALQEALATVGPIETGMDLNPENYMDYAKGVFYEPSCESSYIQLDHAIVLVGYGSRPQDYWLIKNSMGTSWGEDGYMKLARNRGNHCGIATRAIYPVVGSATTNCAMSKLLIFCGLLMRVIVWN